MLMERGNSKRQIIKVLVWLLQVSFFMTPQELFDKAKSEIEADSKTSQELQQQLNNINLKIFANQELLKSLKNVDGVAF